MQTFGAMVKRLRSRWFQLKAFQSFKASRQFKGSMFNDQTLLSIGISHCHSALR
jgi:hypothetical protein